MKTIILLMVALSPTDRHVENAVVFSNNMSSLASCQALATYVNKTSDFYWFCMEETQ